MVARPLLAVTALLLVSDCTTYDLLEEGLIYRPRVLAMKMQPPEAQIGDWVRITPLIATPLDAPAALDHTWLDCGEPGGMGETVDWCAGRNEQRVIGITDELVYQVPDNLPSVEVQMLAARAGYWKRISLEVDDRAGGKDRAFKRLVVQPPPRPNNIPGEAERLAALRNRNPTLPPLELFSLDKAGDETAIADDAPLEANRDYLFRVALSPSERQDYAVQSLDLTGIDPSKAQELTPEEIRQRLTIQVRRERLIIRYYRSDGRFGRDQKPVRSVDSTKEEPVYYPAEVTWSLNTKERAAALPDRIRLWFVVVDGRGGMDWQVVTRALIAGTASARSASMPPAPPPGLR